MKIVIKTLGCKANRAESDSLFQDLRKEYDIVEMNEGGDRFKNLYKDVDVFIVNSCTVTHSADRKSRQAIRNFKQRYPSCKIIVFGCGVNVSAGEYENMEEVDYAIKNVDEIIETLKNLENKYGGSENCAFGSDFHDAGQRTRAVVKIQDGCNNFCSYCIIPHARGPEYSYPVKEILDNVKEKEAQGFREIVLTGITLGKWEADGMSLPDLFELLIKKTSDVRFRVSSIEPENFSDKFFYLFKTGRFCPHIHMSLQSGDDRVLKRMRRNYDTSLYLDVCNRFREIVPDIGLTTDVIVGFPGETDEEFNATCDFVKKIIFLKLHVFPFSKRKNTAAYHMPNQIADSMKKMRAQRLRKIDDKMGNDFKKSILGNEYEVLVETQDNGICHGFTPNYVPVQFDCNREKDLTNEMVKVRLENVLKNKIVQSIIV